jgi:Lon protease-like protein
MFKLPLFPLQTVLFPGTPLHLHIFEERYKLMIGRCVEANQSFGVVLLKSGVEVLGAGPQAKPFSIGCTAKITQVQAMSGGRLNIVVVGLERFRILALHHDQPYLTGEVETYPLRVDDIDALRRSGRQLRPWVERYLNALEQTEKIDFAASQLPNNSLSLAYLAAFLLKAPITQKQELLSVPSADEFIDSVRSLYRKEVTLLQALMTPEQTEQTSPFSLN